MLLSDLAEESLRVDFNDLLHLFKVLLFEEPLLSGDAIAQLLLVLASARLDDLGLLFLEFGLLHEDSLVWGVEEAHLKCG